MKPHEREYFVSRIRAGVYSVKYEGLDLTILSPSIEMDLKLNQIYMDSYNEAKSDGVKTEDEMTEWMMQAKLWSKQDEKAVEELREESDESKVQIYLSRNNSMLLSRHRANLKKIENRFVEIISKKSEFLKNTCEGIASSDKTYAWLESCTFYGDELFLMSPEAIDAIYSSYSNSLLNDSELRELARTDPWRSLWMMADAKTFPLFPNNGRVLSSEQRNLLIWSKMYDNVNESPDAPTEDVISDDDMLDGWFVIQKRKRDKERVEAEMNASTGNDKIKNASEVFIVSPTKQDAQKVNSMNSVHAKEVKRQRLEKIKSSGTASQLDFVDEKIKLNQQSNEAFKDRFKR